MTDLILNSAALDVAGIAPFVAMLYLAGVRPRRRKPRLRVVADAVCWCAAFSGKRMDCYCVGFDSKSEKDGVK